MITCNFSIIEKGTFRILATGRNSSVDSFYQWLIENGVPVHSSIVDIFNYVSSSSYNVEVEVSFFYGNCFYNVVIYGGKEND